MRVHHLEPNVLRPEVLTSHFGSRFFRLIKDEHNLINQRMPRDGAETRISTMLRSAFASIMETPMCVDVTWNGSSDSTERTTVAIMAAEETM